jgi:hypothetical protein
MPRTLHLQLSTQTSSSTFLYYSLHNATSWVACLWIHSLVSRCLLQVSLEVPAWCSFLPTSSIQGVGSRVLQGVLDAMVPRFLAQVGQTLSQSASGVTDLWLPNTSTGQLHL